MREKKEKLFEGLFFILFYCGKNILDKNYYSKPIFFCLKGMFELNFLCFSKDFENIDPGCRDAVRRAFSQLKHLAEHQGKTLIMCFLTMVLKRVLQVVLWGTQQKLLFDLYSLSFHP